MVPGQERFAICLVAPTVVLLARGAALAWDAASPRWRVVLAAATLAGWPLLADFHAHYFRFIERTWRPVAPRVPHRGRRTEASRPAIHPGKTGGQGTVPIFAGTVAAMVGENGTVPFIARDVDRLLAVVESLADPLLGIARSRRSRAGARRNRLVRTTIAGRWPKGGCGSSSSAARKSCSRRNRNWPPQADPLVFPRLRPPAAPLRAPCRRRVTSAHSLQSLQWGRHYNRYGGADIPVCLRFLRADRNVCPTRPISRPTRPDSPAPFTRFSS